MRPSQPLAFLAKRLNDVRGHRSDSRRAQRRNRRMAAAIQPAILHCLIEPLEARLLLTVSAPASATVLEGGSIQFSQTSKDSIAVTESNGNPLGLTLSVSHGALTLQNTAGLSFLAGSNDSATMTVVGTPSNLNLDLIGLGYAPNFGYSGDDSLVITAGNESGSATVPIFINTWINSTFFSDISEGTATRGAGINLALELPNGDLMVHELAPLNASGNIVDGGASAKWYEIAPDNAGSYADGTWKALAPMHKARLYFSSVVLPNGDVFVFGGEYASDGAISFDNNGNVVPNGTAGSTRQYSDSAEIYNPATNTWTLVASDPLSYPANTLQGQTKALKMGGDQPSEVLPNGSVLVGDVFSAGTEIYTPSFNSNGVSGPGSWTTGPTKQYTDNEASAEESWVKLGNGDILCYDIYASQADGQGEADLYEPPSTGYANGHWVEASNGDLPILTTFATGNELGPALLEPGDGDAVFFGANGLTAIYNPTTNSWSQGPTLPSALLRNPSNGQRILTQLTTGDAPGAVLPNGDDLLALSPTVSVASSGNETFPAPTFLCEWNPVTNVFTNVTPPLGVTDQAFINSFGDSMLVLPSGQVLLTNGFSQLAFYTLAPGDGPDPSWAPTITSLARTANGTFTLTGTQLNGPDGGAAYGDDEQMAENYPLVQLTNSATGAVSYATTSNWSANGVATGNTSETVNVVMPSVPGVYSVVVIADGIASQPTTLVIGQRMRQPSIDLNEGLASPSEAGELPGIGAPAALIANDNPSPAVPPTLNVTNSQSTHPYAPGPTLDFVSNPMSADLTEAASHLTRFSPALENAESVQWAGLSAALDILSA
jgi:hypothetical protein